MANDNKRQHLTYIQGIVNRLAQNSFLVKGWTVTLVSAILALSARVEGQNFIALSTYLPVILFWILDGYFLWQERLFRAKYDEVRLLEETSVDYSMNIGPFIGGRNTWSKSMFSKTLNIFYLTLSVLIGLVIFLLFTAK